MSLVYGNNVNLYAKVGGGTLDVVLCSKSCVLNLTTEIADRTTPESGIFRQVKAMGISGTLQIDGDSDYDSPVGIDTFIDWQLAMETVDWSFDTTSESATNIVYSGSAIIENISYTGPVEAPATFTISLVIDGEISKS